MRRSQGTICEKKQNALQFSSRNQHPTKTPRPVVQSTIAHYRQPDEVAVEDITGCVVEDGVQGWEMHLHFAAIGHCAFKEPQHEVCLSAD
jgi:hypothetical protein